MTYLRGVVLIAALLILITAFTIEYTSQPNFCSSCHEMEPMYQVWSTSSHSGVKCYDCHSDPGLPGLARAKAKGIIELYRHYSGTYKLPISINSDTIAFSRRCLSCHQVLKNGGPHNERHMDIGINCTRCHVGFVHDPKKKDVLPNREVCVDCHGNFGNR